MEQSMRLKWRKPKQPNPYSTSLVRQRG